MKNGWTGGQYSVFRVSLGLYVGFLFIRLIPLLLQETAANWDNDAWPRALEDAGPLSIFALWPHPYFAMFVLNVGVVLAAFFAVGFLDRISAIGCGYIIACVVFMVPLYGPLHLALALPLCLHWFIPPAPYGSWRARGRADPAGGWRMPPLMFLIGRGLVLFMFLGFAILILAHEGEPVGVWGGAHVFWVVLYGVLPLLLAIKRLRLLVWLTLMAGHVPEIWIFESFEGAVFVLTLMLFNPDWVRPKIGSGKATMFYDGECALCHGGVRFILAEDRFDSILFVPLQSEIFRERVTATERERMGDTIVFETETGELLSRSTAIVYMLGRLGGLWRIAGVLLRLIPRPLRELAYDLVARTRYRVFGRKKEHCPIIPPELRSRFEL
ncbi:MAG: DCC1-like thiol-disulfide oxidoreductase family protein [Planctomycetota bacterium]|nr:DCC1-like thiol-disulfide oxidoreductase family protein [Planctomycetota bacterium]